MQRGRDLTLRGVLRLETASFASHLKFNSLTFHVQICHSETFRRFSFAVFQTNSRDVFQEARGSVARGHSGSRTQQAPPETFQSHWKQEAPLSPPRQKHSHSHFVGITTLTNELAFGQLMRQLTWRGVSALIRGLNLLRLAGGGWAAALRWNNDCLGYRVNSGLCCPAVCLIKIHFYRKKVRLKQQPADGGVNRKRPPLWFPFSSGGTLKKSLPFAHFTSSSVTSAVKGKKGQHRRLLELQRRWKLKFPFFSFICLSSGTCGEGKLFIIDRKDLIRRTGAVPPE